MLKHRRKPRHVAIGVCDEQRVWAISVDGADPLVIGTTDDPVGLLVCAAANTLELPTWKLRAGIVWGLGPRPRQSHTIPLDGFEQIVSGETSKPGDSLHLMALAHQQHTQNTDENTD